MELETYLVEVQTAGNTWTPIYNLLALSIRQTVNRILTLDNRVPRRRYRITPPLHSLQDFKLPLAQRLNLH